MGLYRASAPGKRLEVPPGRVYYWQVLFESSNNIDYAQAPPIFYVHARGHAAVKARNQAL